MKPVFSWKSLCCLLCFALLAGCSKDDAEPDDVLPPLVWPDDIATAIPDSHFRAFCLYNFDTNGDGRLSKAEVLTVKRIDPHYDQSGQSADVLSLEGIEYFSNLKTLYWEYSNLKSLDLRYNARLEKVRFEYMSALAVLRGPVGYAPLTIEFPNFCNLKELDLSGSANVRELLFSVNSQDKAKLTSVNLPDPSHLQYLTIAAADAACYDALLADGANLKVLYCNFYPGAVLDLSRCPKLETLWVQTFAGSALTKIRMCKGIPPLREVNIYDENSRDCSHLIKIEYVE